MARLLSEAAPADEPVVPETECIESARSGDVASLGRLCTSIGPYIERVIGRMVGPTPDVEDLVQTSFVEAVASLHRFRGEASFKTWVTRIAVNTVQHYLRAKRVRRHVPLEVVR